MFLVRDGKELVFLHKDPRLEGYKGKAEEVVLYYPTDVHDWPEGAPRPQLVVGVSPDNQTLFQVFRFEEDCKTKGYVKVSTGAPHIFADLPSFFLWKIQKKLMPEHATEHLAINLVSGEYVLGKTAGEVFDAFMQKWPDTPMYKCRVDGAPSLKFHR